MLDDKNFALVQKMLDLTELRAKVIAQNIANVNVPGYKSREVNFEDDLKKAIQSGDKEDIQKIEPEITISKAVSFRNDGNNVDMEKEMVALAKNNYDVYARFMTFRINSIRDAIEGAGKV